MAVVITSMQKGVGSALKKKQTGFQKHSQTQTNIHPPDIAKGSGES